MGREERAWSECGSALRHNVGDEKKPGRGPQFPFDKVP
jgi:hypothetical protein